MEPHNKAQPFSALQGQGYIGRMLVGAPRRPDPRPLTWWESFPGRAVGSSRPSPGYSLDVVMMGACQG